MGAAGAEKRGPGLRRELAQRLPVPDLANDKGGALVVDIAAIDLGADEIAEPLSKLADGRR
jgi:hypothetical protein